MADKEIVNARLDALKTYWHTCTITTPGTPNASDNGRTVTGGSTSSSLPCRFRRVAIRKQLADGTILNADASLFVPWNTTIPNLATVTVNNEAFVVMESAPLYLGGADIVEIRLLLGVK